MPPLFPDATASLTYFAVMFFAFLYAFLFQIVMVLIERSVEQTRQQRLAGEHIESRAKYLASFVLPRLVAMLAFLPMALLPPTVVWLSLPRPQSSEAVLGYIMGVLLSATAQEVLYWVLTARARRSERSEKGSTAVDKKDEASPK